MPNSMVYKNDTISDHIEIANAFNNYFINVHVLILPYQTTIVTHLIKRHIKNIYIHHLIHNVNL